MTADEDNQYLPPTHKTSCPHDVSHLRRMLYHKLRHIRLSEKQQCRLDWGLHYLENHAKKNEYGRWFYQWFINCPLEPYFRILVILMVDTKPSVYFKEITESLSALSILIKRYKVYPSEAYYSPAVRPPGYQPPDLILFDVCSGSGFSSILISMLYPKSRIYLVDIFKNSKLTAFIDDLPNAVFISKDVHDKDMVATIFQLLSDHYQTVNSPTHSSLYSNTLTFFFGIHLCGNLSLRFIEIFQSFSSLHPAAAILIPCCLDRKDKKRNSMIKSLSKQTFRLATPECLWSLLLWKKMDDNFSGGMKKDESIYKSGRTWVIWGSKLIRG
ncbi:hypothetical protein BKA69DRAFT_1125829 [Paraphysoderma sedebokerense]|nr:hypothetical protein BKA69DRAFT_1125829 [Paraphysoderma sedebokerense]